MTSTLVGVRLRTVDLYTISIACAMRLRDIIMRFVRGLRTSIALCMPASKTLRQSQRIGYNFISTRFFYGRFIFLIWNEQKREETENKATKISYHNCPNGMVAAIVTKPARHVYILLVDPNPSNSCDQNISNDEKNRTDAQSWKRCCCRRKLCLHSSPTPCPSCILFQYGNERNASSSPFGCAPGQWWLFGCLSHTEKKTKRKCYCESMSSI